MSSQPLPEFEAIIPVILIAASQIFIKAAASLINHLPKLVLMGTGQGHAEVEDQIARTNTQLVLLDLDMPGKSGLETIRSLRQSWPNLTIIASSTMDTRSSMKAALHAGADAFISKTRLSEDLMPSIQRMMSEMDIGSRDV